MDKLADTILITVGVVVTMVAAAAMVLAVIEKVSDDDSYLNVNNDIDIADLVG